jgi:hypothetical protein
LKDKTCWEVSSASLRGRLVLRIKDGQTREEALAEYQKRPQMVFFTSIRLPRYVTAPVDGGVYGASELTALGIKTMPVKSHADDDDSPTTPRKGPRRKQQPSANTDIGRANL